MAVITIPKPLREKLGEDATESFVEVLREIDLESKKDLVTKEVFIKEITEIKTELKLIKWIMGVILACVVSLILKTFLTP
jgi:hypothetical protein